MSQILWRDKMSLNYPPLDDDHRSFLEVINSATIAAHANDFKKMDQVFEECYDYVREHFSKEEDVMERIRFPDMEAHVQAHRTFIQNISEFRTRYVRAEKQSLKSQIAVEAADFLNLWFLGHLLSRDRLLKPYLVRLRNLPPRMDY